tara:strand:+ start:101 stop:871 length:771 start_codon:yes stop_codon:yes gene_type:complete
MSTIKVDTIATRTGSGNITASNTIAGTSATLSGTLGVTGATTLAGTTLSNSTLLMSSSLMQFSGNISLPNVGACLFRPAADTIAFGINNGQRVSVNQHGLLFGTDTAAANALDDYEEGTFEVVITGTVSGTATGNSGAGAGASYVKIGETVFYRGYFANPSISGTMDGSLRLALPFTNRNTDRFDNGSGGFIVGHREISSGTTSNEITLKTGRGENFARLRRKYTMNSRTEDTDLTQGNASINSSTLIWFQGTIKV